MAMFLFYTFEGYAISPKNDDLESIQVLGFENGNTLEKAFDSLIKNNEWIINSGFDLNKVKSKTILTQEDSDNIEKVINYLWNEEGKHFQESGFPNDHIYLALKKLKHLIQ